jgi:hypothetical protein
MRVLCCRKLTLLLLIGLCAACGGGASSNSTTSSSEASPTPVASPSPQTDFERTLQFVRNGQFTYIYVISRKDGKPLQPEDSIFLKTTAPQVVDWAATLDKIKVVAGTNFNLDEGNMELLKKRFVVEDYSGK